MDWKRVGSMAASGLLAGSLVLSVGLALARGPEEPSEKVQPEVTPTPKKPPVTPQKTVLNPCPSGWRWDPRNEAMLSGSGYFACRPAGGCVSRAAVPRLQCSGQSTLYQNTDGSTGRVCEIGCSPP